MVTVSVIVPIYNAEKNLERCLKSIIKQTYEDFELILVNDGSTDKSLAICKKYQMIDKRIFIKDGENRGSISARRKGIEASKSEYVMFVDADDWVDNRCVEIVYGEIIQKSADVVVCNMFKVLGNSGLIKQKQRNNSMYFGNDRIYNKEEIRKELVVAFFHGHPFPTSLCAKLYKKALLMDCGNYLDRIRFLGEDLYFNLEIFLKADRIAVIDKPMYFYRLGGFTSKYMPHLFNDMINGYQIQKEVIDEWFQDSLLTTYNGISIMLLNTFRTCLYNLLNSELSENVIKEIIGRYVSDENILEATKNEGSVKFFHPEYLQAITNKEIDYLYDLGTKMYKNAIPKRMLKNFISRISFI